MEMKAQGPHQARQVDSLRSPPTTRELLCTPYGPIVLALPPPAAALGSVFVSFCLNVCLSLVLMR